METSYNPLYFNTFFSVTIECIMVTSYNPPYLVLSCTIKMRLVTCAFMCMRLCNSKKKQKFAIVLWYKIYYPNLTPYQSKRKVKTNCRKGRLNSIGLRAYRRYKETQVRWFFFFTYCNYLLFLILLETKGLCVCCFNSALVKLFSLCGVLYGRGC